MTDLDLQHNQENTQGSPAGVGRLLAFDTSTSSMTVALLEGDRLAAERQELAERNHSIQLFPLVESTLAEFQLAPEQIDAYGVGIGPGSYTGVRIAVTAAKTMAWALNKPVVGVSSLAALALGAVLGTDGEPAFMPLAEGETVWIVPLVNARRGQAFTALFAAKLQDATGTDGTETNGDGMDGTGRDNTAMAGKPELDVPVDDGLAAASFDNICFSRVKPDAVRLVEAWVEDLLALIAQADEPPAGIAFVGEPAGFESWLDALTAHWPQGKVSVQPLLIRAYHIGRLAAQRLVVQGAAAADNTHGLVPNYAQLAEAEVKLLAKRREEAR